MKLRSVPSCVDLYSILFSLIRPLVDVYQFLQKINKPIQNSPHLFLKIVYLKGRPKKRRHSSQIYVKGIILKLKSQLQNQTAASPRTSNLKNLLNVSVSLKTKSKN